jgi:hypothetical protein
VGIIKAMDNTFCVEGNNNNTSLAKDPLFEAKRLRKKGLCSLVDLYDYQKYDFVSWDGLK